MPGEAVPVLHVLSSRQGFALSRSVALTAGSALLPGEYKQTSPVAEHDRNSFQAGFGDFFFSCFSFSLVLDAPGVSGAVLRVGSQLFSPLSPGSRRETALAEGRTAEQRRAAKRFPSRDRVGGEEPTRRDACVPPSLSTSHQGSRRVCSPLAERTAPAISANGSQARARRGCP